jgi:signal transduction histidine kinase
MARFLALGLWGLSIVLWIGTLAYVQPVQAFLRPDQQRSSLDLTLFGLLAFLAMQGLATIGLLVILRGANRRFGWLMLATSFLSQLDAFAGNYSVYALLVAPEADLPFAHLAAWVQNLWVIFLSLLFIYIPLLFPDGALPSPRWKPIFKFITLFLSVFVLVLAFADLPLTNVFLEVETPVRNPLGIISVDFVPAPVARVIHTGVLVLFGASLLAAMASLLFRWRGAGAEVRQQLKWLLYTLSLLVALRIVDWIALALLEPTGVAYTFELIIRSAQFLALIGVVGALGFAVLKYRLYDIDLVINRTLVYGALTVIVAGGYVLAVTALGTVVPSEGILLPSLVATGVIAALFSPLRERLQRAVNRLMFGERDDPYTVLSQLGRQLSSSAAPDATLQSVVETVGNALKLPYVAIQLEQGGTYRTRAEFGTAASGKIALPLVHQNEAVGELVVAPRAPAESLASRDRQLLEDIAHQAGAVAHAVRLTADLRRSRRRLVTAREEERRRLRRDLHDGLGPTLASQTLKLDTAMDLIREDPDAAIAQLQELYGQTQDIVAEIRRLVHQLRPPALDDLGLVGAVEAHLGHNRRTGDGLRIAVEAPADGLPPLPAAVELAAYRITMEAVTNVVRHAQAEHCHVRYDLQNGLKRTNLRIEIGDDGQGLPDRPRHGVGMNSMRERAEELGGRVAIETAEGSGTRVCADLPLPEEKVP